MKKLLILAAALVLTLSVFTGCGCTRQNAGMNTTPSTEMTILPTNIPETTAPLLPQTEPATLPSTAPVTEAPDDGPMGDATTGADGTMDASEDATEGARSRMK